MKNKEQITKELTESTENLKKLAMRNAEIAIELLGKGR